MQADRIGFTVALRGRKRAGLRRRVAAGSALLALSLLATPVFAGEIYGRVEWSGGSPAAGAKVVFRMEGEALDQDTANGKGRYQLNPRQTGKGAVVVEVDGEESTEIPAYSLDDSLRLDLELDRQGGRLRLRKR